MYADDTTVLLSNKNFNDLIACTNTELMLVYRWFYNNKLSINLAKTNYLVFSLRPFNTNCSIYLNNSTIERKTYVKFLGIIIDDRLLWKEHINYLCIKLSHMILLC
jgi:hypothetical protein